MPDTEKAMAPHSSTLALENPMDGGAWWAAVHGVAKSRTQLSDFIFTSIHWRRKWQPTPVFLPGESQGRGSLMGCRLWGHTESATTEATQQQQQQERHIGVGNGNPLQYSCWRIPWMKEPGRLQSMGWQRVEHD